LEKRLHTRQQEETQT